MKRPVPALLSLDAARKLIPEPQRSMYTDADLEQLIATMTYLADACLRHAGERVLRKAS